MHGLHHLSQPVDTCALSWLVDSGLPPAAAFLLCGHSRARSWSRAGPLARRAPGPFSLAGRRPQERGRGTCPPSSGWTQRRRPPRKRLLALRCRTLPTLRGPRTCGREANDDGGHAAIEDVGPYRVHGLCTHLLRLWSTLPAETMPAGNTRWRATRDGGRRTDAMELKTGTPCPLSCKDRVRKCTRQTCACCRRHAGSALGQGGLLGNTSREVTVSEVEAAMPHTPWCLSNCQDSPALRLEQTRSNAAGSQSLPRWTRASPGQ